MLSIGSVQGQSHAVLRQIDTGRDKVVDRSRVCFTFDVVVDYPEVLQMGVPVSDGAIQGDQGEELKALFGQNGRLGKLLEALHHVRFVAAAIFFISAASVENAEVFEAAMGPVRAQVEAVHHQSAAVVRKAVMRNCKAAALRYFQGEKLVGGELRQFRRDPEFDDVRGPSEGRRELARGRGACRKLRLVPDQELRLHAADSGIGGKLLNQVSVELATPAAGKDLVHGLERYAFIELFFCASEANAPELRPSGDGQQIEVVEATASFRKREAEAFPKRALRQIHFKDGGIPYDVSQEANRTGMVTETARLWSASG